MHIVEQNIKCPQTCLSSAENAMSKLHRIKFNYFKRAVESREGDSETFWKMYKPYFSNTNSGTSRFHLNSEGQYTLNDK